MPPKRHLPRVPPASRTGKGATDPAQDVRMTALASPGSVRAMLIRLRDQVRCWGAADEMVARVELVAAEICNNIAEHGFDERETGEMGLRVSFTPPDLLLEITDQGAAPPAELLHRPKLPPIDVPRLDLPEGGFGWFLVHSEVDDLIYERRAGRNRFSLRFSPRQA